MLLGKDSRFPNTFSGLHYHVCSNMRRFESCLFNNSIIDPMMTYSGVKVFPGRKQRVTNRSIDFVVTYVPAKG